MLSIKDIKELTEKLQHMPDSIPVQVYSAIMQNMNLHIENIDESAKDIMNKPAQEIVVIKDFDKLNAYLLAIPKMQFYINQEIQKWEIHLNLHLKPKYKNLLTKEKIINKNKIRNINSQKDIEDNLITNNKVLETLKYEIDIIENYVKMLNTNIPILTEMNNALKYTVAKRKLEFEYEMRRK